MRKSILAVLLAMLMLLGGCTNNGQVNDPSDDPVVDDSKPKREIALTIGTKEVDVVEFLYQYNEAISNFQSEYYYLAASLGIDFEGDLSEQFLPNGQSYHDYFVANATDFLAEQKYLVLAAEEAGFKMSEQHTKEVEDSFTSFYAQLESAGYTLEEYLTGNYGPDITPEDFEHYIMEDAVAFYYYKELIENIPLNDDIVNAYYNENKASFDSVDFNIYHFAYEVPVASEESTETEGETDESYKNDARSKAEQALATVTSPEDFESCIKAVLSADELASYVDGYTEVTATYSEVFEALANWLFDESRQTGDKTVLEYNNGYFVVMLGDRYLDSYNTIDVRHCLIATSTVSNILVEGSDEIDREATAAAQAASDAAVYEKAEALLNAWVDAGAKEEDFITMANENSDDGAVDGLYEMVTKGQMVEEFEAWCFDETRKAGDYGIVKTPYGYHLMYFVGENEPQWVATAKSLVLQSEYLKIFDAHVEKYPIVMNDEVIDSIG